MISWSAAFETGVDSIDGQHRVLVEILNRLEQGILDGSSQQLLPMIAEELEAYTRVHFANEEDCMFRYRCPKAEANKAAHAVFVRMVARARDTLRASGTPTSDALTLHHQLWDWLRDHILGVDVSLRDCAQPPDAPGSAPIVPTRRST